MTCWQCGAPLPPDVGFCRACGAFVRPRSGPVNTPGFTVRSPQSPPGPLSERAAPSPSSSASESAATLSGATPSTAWPPAAPVAAWGSSSSAAHAGTLSSGLGQRSNLSDLLAGVGAGFVLISLLLTWYSVTITPLGVQFFESNSSAHSLRACSPRLPQAWEGSRDR